MRARGSHCLPDTKALLDTLQATARENADRGFGDALKGAKDATLTMCKYYDEHRQPDASKALSQFISLALFLNPAPNLTSKVKGAVSTRPFARVCRNKRHVPETGTSTPTRSFPGVVELPLT